MNDRLSSTFSALADPTRRAILQKLATGEFNVRDLSEPFGISAPAISKHLKVLEESGLITRQKKAQQRPCKLQAKPLAEANEWLLQYKQLWEERLDRLEELLSNLQSLGNPSGQ